MSTVFQKNVKWLQDGGSHLPTILVFTGYGGENQFEKYFHFKGWRIGVLPFPNNSFKEDRISAQTLALEVNEVWKDASVKILIGFSFGASPTYQYLKEVYTHSLTVPDRVVMIGPSQWSKTPWWVLASIPIGVRLSLLDFTYKKRHVIQAVLNKIGTKGLQIFWRMVYEHNGLKRSRDYLRYVDWIVNKSRILKLIKDHKIKTTFVIGTKDKLVRYDNTKNLEKLDLDFVDVEVLEAKHFSLVPMSVPLLEQLLLRFENNGKALAL